MPKPKWEKYREIIGELLNSKKFIDGTNSSPRKLPFASNTRNELEDLIYVVIKKLDENIKSETSSFFLFNNEFHRRM